MNLHEKLAQGKKVHGTMIRVIRNQAIALYAKNAGLDFILFDCEHYPFNLETLQDNFLFATSCGVSPLIRIPSISKDNISRILDSGAEGIMVPMTETKEQAEEIVKWAKFAPIGDRGVSTTGAHTNYLGSSIPKFIEAENKKVFVIAQIETKLAVENSEEIAAVNGIDALIIGPGDLSQSLGIPGDMFNELELNAIQKVANAAKKYGKHFGLHGPVPLQEKFKDYIDVSMVGADSAFLADAFKKIKADCVSLD